ncbi:efflux RND transporter permease subunit [Marinimicrobium agarilyticum]|uniref:efflux RND transporter permease subunit n=1 Tax=Marinimicrobium agarilyticum TaxID=306546 RepID=UPI0004294768|nr:MMPL family transporter [Marinimicrobium agarilyticum]
MNHPRQTPLVRWAITHPRTVFWGLGVLTVLFTALLPLIQIDTDPENMLPEDNPERVFHNQVQERFSMHDTLVVGMVHPDGIYQPRLLADLHSVTRYAEQLGGVISPDVMSLASVDNITQNEQNTLRFEWMMRTPPETAQDAERIRTQVEDLPLLFDTLVSADGKAASVYIPIEDKNRSYALSRNIRAHIDTLDSDAQWHVTGLPVAEDRFGHEMFVQMGISAPLAGLTIFLLLWVFFRNIPFILSPMIVAMATVLITMGALIGAGFTVHIMSSMIAIFLMPIAVVDSVHILSEFADRYRRGANAKVVVTEVMSHLFKPMLLTSVTSAVGFFSLMLTPIPPVQIFGFFVGMGILLAFAMTIVVVPAYLTSLNPSTLDRMVDRLPDEDKTRLAGALTALGRAARARTRLWVLGFSALFAVSVWGITQIQINDNPVRWFKADHELRIADRTLNDHFAGTYDAYLVFDSTVSPDAQARELLDEAMAKEILSENQQAWLSAQRDALTGEHALSDLILALDDRLFETSGTDARVFETLMEELEQLQSRGQTFLQPTILAYLDRLESALIDTGRVGKSNSLVDVVKTVNRELRSGEAKDFQLPSSAEAVAQTLLQYQSSHRPQDLWHFVTPDYQSSLIWLQLTSGDNQQMSAVVDAVNRYIQDHPLPEGLSMQWAGKTYLNVVWQSEMVEGMATSLVSAFVIVLVMMVLLFRSLWFGLIAMLPLTLTITGIYGLIGWIGKDYDMPIAVLSALTLGLSIDFAIHFVERARATARATGDWSQTLDVMFREPARAIARNAIVIAVGFTPLLLAPLVPYITVGVFLASIMALSALVTLVLLPVVITLLRRILFGFQDSPENASTHTDRSPIE